MNRAKVSVTVDPIVLRMVDAYVEQHEGLDRSKVIDVALGLWAAAQQDAAMATQFNEPSEPAAERASWHAIRRGAAGRRLRLP